MQKINKKIIFIIIIISGMIYGIFNYFTQNKNKENLENISQDIIINNQTENTTEENNNQEKIVIHITGAICNEGIYELEENSRIADAVKMAGGLKEDADLKQINLAYVLEDGMKINIPSKNDNSNENINNTENYITKEKLNSSNNTNSAKTSKININSATQTELETLPGIGPSTALKIINYRKEKGKFNKIEDIKNVNGIGESKFNKIKEFIKT
jgi:competence protein ComEA